MNPLSPIVFLSRNARNTVPLVGVIVLAVMLLAGIIALINSIPFSIRTIYSYSQEMLGVGPRGDAGHTPAMIARIKEDCPVEVEEIMTCRAVSSQVRSIVGKWPFAVLAVSPNDLPFLLKRMKAKEIVGRLPRSGEPEAIIAESVAKNLKLRIGSDLLGPTLNESYSPKHVKVVGIVESEYWFMITDIDYVRANHFPPVDLGLIFAKNIVEQAKLDRWAAKAFEGDRGQIFAFHQIEKQTNEMFATLYKILNVVIGTLVLVITVMMGMLINIYQSQRLIEFGLLQALGYTRRALLRRVILETVIVVLVGWIIGVFGAYGGLMIAKITLMDPNAFALNPMDVSAYQYTVTAPIAILVTAMVTLILRFRRYDPVSVVERRLL